MVSFTTSAFLAAGLGLCLRAGSVSAAPARDKPGDGNANEASRCFDDARWSGGKQGKNCAWLASKSPDKIDKLCEKKKYQSRCMASCGLCPTVFTFTTPKPTADPVACDAAVGEVSKILGEVQQDQFVSLDGRPLPNFESPAVAYAHVEHCKGVVAEGKPQPASKGDDEMAVMHFEHCSAVVDKVRLGLDGQHMDIGKDVCARAFPWWAVAEIVYEIASSDMFDYGFNYGFNYRRGRDAGQDLPGKSTDRLDSRPVGVSTGTIAAARPVGVPMNSIAAENFAAVLMKQFRQDELTKPEGLYVEMMEGKAAAELAVLAYRCQH